MASPELLERLAATIHDLWREGLARRGWKVAQEFSENARTHDAMVPFDRLSPGDRQEVLQLAQTWADKLADEVEHPRGDDREFTKEEIFVGMPVAWADRMRLTYTDPARRGTDPSGVIGYVTAWTVSEDGASLESIKVAWPDDYVSEHLPVMRELRRLS